MIDDGAGAEVVSHDRVYALLFTGDGRVETHGIYTSLERARRAFVSLATAGLVDLDGVSYSVEEYPLDQPLMGIVVMGPGEMAALLVAQPPLETVLPEE